MNLPFTGRVRLLVNDFNFALLSNGLMFLSLVFDTSFFSLIHFELVTLVLVH